MTVLLFQMMAAETIIGTSIIDKEEKEGINRRGKKELRKKQQWA